MLNDLRTLPVRLQSFGRFVFGCLVLVLLCGCDRRASEAVATQQTVLHAQVEQDLIDRLQRLTAARDYDTLFAERERLEQLVGSDDPRLAVAAFAALLTVDGHIDPAWELAWSTSDGFARLLAAIPLMDDSQLRIALAERALPLLDDDALSLLSGWPVEQRLAARKAIIASLEYVPGRETEIRQALETAQQDAALRAETTAALQSLGTSAAARMTSPPRQLVRRYAMSDVEPALDWPTGSRSFARGRRVYHELGCHRCHVRSEHDTLIGPSLTATEYQPTRRELAEAILEPDKLIAENYRQFLLLVNGKPITGIVTEQADDYLIVIADPMFDCTPQRIEREQLDEEPEPLAASAMPAGTVDVLALDELLDLLAYVESKGDPHRDFSRQRVSR